MIKTYFDAQTCTEVAGMAFLVALKREGGRGGGEEGGGMSEEGGGRGREGEGREGGGGRVAGGVAGRGSEEVT